MENTTNTIVSAVETTDIVKTYLEIGVLGLCAILVVIVAYLLIKKLLSKNDYKDSRIESKDNALEDKFNTMIELLQKQNQEYQEQQSKNTDTLIQSIVQGIVYHVPSAEENSKLTKVAEEIDSNLQEILISTNASRVSLVQYHNGGKGINKQSFLKMSITNEQVQLGVKPQMSDFKDQFRTVLAYYTREIENNGYCFIENVEDVKTLDASMYEFMKDRNVQSKFGIAVKNKEGVVIGFICAEYLDKSKADSKKIESILKEKQKVIESLLSL